jgi:hypothetical protein
MRWVALHIIEKKGAAWHHPDIARELTVTSGQIYSFIP